MSSMDRLEAILRQWEDLSFLACHTTIARRSDGTRDPRHPAWAAPRFRSFLLDVREEVGDRIVDFIDYDSAENPKEVREYMGSLCSLPTELAFWCARSRRMFHPSLDLQALLTATTLQNVKWSDVSLPFDSFSIALDHPLHAGAFAFDHILVTRYAEGETNGISIRLIDRDAGPLLTRFDRRDLERAATKGLRKLGQVSTRVWSRLFPDDLINHRTFATWLDLGSDDVISSSVDASIADLEKREAQDKPDNAVHWNALSRAARIAIGLCLYLRTLPPESRHRSETTAPRSAPERGRPRVITDEALVCTVGTKHVLTAEERDLFLQLGRVGGTGYEVSPHFRRGHWRRSPGTGRDRTAPQNVHVEPCLVRRDRLHPGELPIGAETKAE